MNKKQRENAAKYLYDISKGIFLMTVVGSFVNQEINLYMIILGSWAAIIFFNWAFRLDRKN
ncbi:MAG: hypothetical protein FVQ77_09695 [Cytophagales bacterium]|nr:hypothetical protein [Cytophagales bacterium]